MKNADMLWDMHWKPGPLMAAAIHNGHQLREEVADLMALDDIERLREEDPFTAQWTSIGNTQIIGLRSRFEVDLNRPRERAVYLDPEDAWGLQVWKRPPPPEMIMRSLEAYDAFYTAVHHRLSKMTQQFGQVVVFDLHSYNHRRQGPDAPPDNPDDNPDINIGTGTMNRAHWASLVDRFITDLQTGVGHSRQLDVRENVKFKGGHFSRWIHQAFPTSVCSLAIEIKKFFMDEWTGEPDQKQIQEILTVLQSTHSGIHEELRKRGARL